MKMNEPKIFNFENHEVRTLPKKDKSFMGRLYVIVLNDGLKIGISTNLKERFRALRKQLVDYGGKEIKAIYFSIPHTNYKENEKHLLDEFSAYRKTGTELINADISSVFRAVQKIKYKDNSIQLEEEAKNTSDFFIDFTKGVFNHE